jgi:hypothetical protein
MKKLIKNNKIIILKKKEKKEKRNRNGSVTPLGHHGVAKKKMKCFSQTTPITKTLQFFILFFVFVLPTMSATPLLTNNDFFLFLLSNVKNTDFSSNIAQQRKEKSSSSPNPSSLAFFTLYFGLNNLLVPGF